MKIPALVASMLMLGTALPASAQGEAELRQQLEAQKFLNAQLRKRVEALESAQSGAPATPALRSVDADVPIVKAESPEATTAIEEALVAKGLVLLPTGSFRITPGIDWTHSGSSGSQSRSDTYTASVNLQAGLPFGLMLSANAPYVDRSTSIGSNSGAGDVSLGLAKLLNEESDRLPSFVANINYFHDNGRDAFEPVQIGSGFRAVNASISAIKRYDPVALYGRLSYTHQFGKNVSADNFFGETSFNGRITPGDSWGYRVGASLAATPDITLDASISGAFIRGADVRPDGADRFVTPKSTVVFINLGAGMIITPNLSLLVSAAAGATADSPDLSLSVSLPYRF